MSAPYPTTVPIWRCGPLSPSTAQRAIAVMRSLVPRPFRPQVVAAVFGSAIELFFLDPHAHATMIFVASQIGATEVPSAADLPDVSVWVGPGLIDRFLTGRIRAAALPLPRVSVETRHAWFLANAACQPQQRAA